MSEAKIISMQIGLPRTLGVENAENPMDRVWTTGFFKEPVKETIWLTKTHLTGDGQADLEHHGGSEKAVLAYAEENYPFWQEKLNLSELPYGAFGENFTIQGMNESSVCIGDTYKIGEAIVQVSQPRKPCWKLSRRWRIRDLALQVQKNGLTGWYYRVLREGYVSPNSTVKLQNRPYPQWTIEKVNQILYRYLNDKKVTAELASCPLLAPNLQQSLYNRAYKGKVNDPTPRLWGDNV